MKKAYVFNYVGPLTDEWHDGGGLLIVTDGDPVKVWEISPHRPGDKAMPDFSQPDHVFDVADDAPDLVVVFPDQGCC